MRRYVVEPDRSVFRIVDRGWVGPDCPKGVYPKSAVHLRFKTRERAQMVCDLLNAEWAEFTRNPE